MAVLRRCREEDQKLRVIAGHRELEASLAQTPALKKKGRC